jgi:hypothetical protein
LAVDATSVYWSACPSGSQPPYCSILKVPIDGGTVVTLAHAPADSRARRPSYAPAAMGALTKTSTIVSIIEESFVESDALETDDETLIAILEDHRLALPRDVAEATAAFLKDKKDREVPLDAKELHELRESAVELAAEYI